jgi:hypothetical protein
MAGKYQTKPMKPEQASATPLPTLPRCGTCIDFEAGECLAGPPIAVQAGDGSVVYVRPKPPKGADDRCGQHRLKTK